MAQACLRVWRATSLPSMRTASAARPMPSALRFQHVEPAMPGQRDDLEAFRMARHHIQGADADRAGGAQNGQALPAGHDDSHAKASAASGRVEVWLSSRSSRPPWPGNRLLLSLTPA